ncbi:DUF2218 domain-containing protein [Oricola thermophila]|uniref:DUF2218 domain-containing protein n=1 Tax=Oricola thermophila TaxID=2742145 RepID=A0A6N1VEQ4_9HYPH|nr:DUF2218 domain-containing protein [Oricola thermophila]QKV19003.1 DUF2218 domain-containing protein [Oricola thermophila]
MATSTTTITTTRASTYLQQLCKHFAHKVPVEFTPDRGTITLPFGTCTLRADNTTLTMTTIAKGDDLARMEQVIGDHFARFSFRENIEVNWQKQH